MCEVAYAIACIQARSESCNFPASACGAHINNAANHAETECREVVRMLRMERNGHRIAVGRIVSEESAIIRDSSCADMRCVNGCGGSVVVNVDIEDEGAAMKLNRMRSSRNCCNAIRRHTRWNDELKCSGPGHHLNSRRIKRLELHLIDTSGIRDIGWQIECFEKSRINIAEEIICWPIRNCSRRITRIRSGWHVWLELEQI